MTTSDDSTTPLKCCKKCGETYPQTLEYFFKDIRNLDGLAHVCKKCRGRRFTVGFKAVVQDGKKQCALCRRLLPLNEEHFRYTKHNPSGFHPRCKECCGGRFGIRAKKAATSDDYLRCLRCGNEYPSTPEYFEPYGKKRDSVRPRCKACCRELRRKRYLKNRNTENELGRQWRLNNREASLERTQRWRLNNRDRMRMHDQKRRSRETSTHSTFTPEQWQDCLNWWHGVCAYCGAQQSLFHILEQDHFIPVSDSGDYVASNIIPACKSCNASKSNQQAAAWLLKKFGKRKAKTILERIQQYFEYAKSLE